MTFKKTAFLVAAAFSLAACEGGDHANKTTDGGFDKKHLSQLQAGIWIDKNGCDHWIIDDGVEGYLDPRLDKYGKPICSGIGLPETTVGQFKSGSAFEDLL